MCSWWVAFGFSQSRWELSCGWWQHFCAVMINGIAFSELNSSQPNFSLKVTGSCLSLYIFVGKPHPCFFVYALRKLFMIYLQIPSSGFLFYTEPSFWARKQVSWLSAPICFTFPCRRALPGCLQSLEGEVFVLCTFFSEVQTRILAGALLIVGCMETVGEILTWAREPRVVSLSSAVPGAPPGCLLWFQWTAFWAQLNFDVVPLILMANTSKGSTQEFQNVTYCFQALFPFASFPL